VRQTLRNLAQKEEDPVLVMEKLDYLLTEYRLPGKMRVFTESSTKCRKDASRQVVQDVQSIVEYFSVDGAGTAKKMYIKDAFPGQRIKFVRQGLQAVDQDFTKLFFCAPDY